MSLKLISVNIERDRHLDRVIPFIQSERPDVLCLQEVCEKDLPLFQKLMGDQFRFSPSGDHDVDGAINIEGEALFSRLPVAEWFVQQYAGPGELRQHNDNMSVREKNDYVKRTITGCEIKKGRNLYRIATTHFTWSEKGQPDQYQRQDVRAMLDITLPLGDLILCGDFNAPRNGEIYSFMREHYNDDIPQRYKTSIDTSLHRAGKERPEEFADKMVDYIFTTHGYSASGVRLEAGISDHMAIVAKVHATGSRRALDWWNVLRW